MGKDVVKKGARRWLRPALWTIFGVWAVIIIVLQIALNSKVLTRVVNDVAKEYVDGDVTFTGVKASMFKSFPNLNVTIDNFSITYPHDRFAAFDSLDVPGGYLLKSGRGEGADTLAHFRKFSVSVNYLAAAATAGSGSATPFLIIQEYSPTSTTPPRRTGTCSATVP